MAELTPFGKAMRKLRIDLDLTMFDVATSLGVSSAFLSAVETGKKPIPRGFVSKIAGALNLNIEQTSLLRSAVDRTRKEIRTDRLKEDQRELVAVFARRIDEIPDDMLEKLKKEILKSNGGDIPFRRRRGIFVPAMSYEKLFTFSDKIRSLFVDDAVIEFPIIKVIEHRLTKIFPDFIFDVLEQNEMGQDEGRVAIGRNELILRNDVYEAVCRGDRRARFTAGHELCHFLLHRNISFARARDDSDKIYYDSEWQADVFSGSLLMSIRHIDKYDSPQHAAELCGISQAAANVIWARYVKEGYINPQASLF